MERISANNSSDWKNSINAISILVVDDDTTCLSIVAATLKKLKYQVVTVNHPNDALSTLRINGGAFDLVVSDVHMPDMNGFELQQAIAQEFNLPVVLMSADDKEGTALKGLESGAVFFILKPVSVDDLRDLWQFAARKKTNNISDEIALSATSVNEDRVNKRKSSKNEGSEELKGENSQSASHKKPKVIWTNSLHNRFLEAIRTIGLERAVPKKILEVMNLPGLTRENVASHLQKYRIFLRRVTEASYTIQNCGDQNGLSTNFMRSNCESSRIISNPPSSSLTPNTFYYQNPGQFPSLNPNFASLPNTNLVSQSRLFGQSQLLSNKGSWVKHNNGYSNLMSRQNNYQTRPVVPFHGHLFDVSGLQNLSTSTLSLPSNNFMYPTNCVGYSTIANLNHHVETSNTSVANNGGEQLENGVIDESGFTPSFDLSEFDFLDEVGLQTTLADDQNQAQRDDDDDFLEALLAPFREDQNFEGI